MKTENLMKTLLVLRHAKSSWKDASQRDFDRPLNTRGTDDAALMGAVMRKKKIDPELILSSPALRARQTAELAIADGKLSGELRFDGRIYEASARRLLEVVAEIDDQFEVAMIIGHNPGFSDLFELITATPVDLPTASLSIIELHISSWAKVCPRSGVLKHLFEPKKLKAGK